MHIPDGFISPQTYLPLYAVSGTLWAVQLKRLRPALAEETGTQELLLPRLAILTALSLTLMTISIPLPGGTSVHATGVALLALTFGTGWSFLGLSLVLMIQALFLGAGGITTLPLNALAIGLVGSASANVSYRLLAPRFERAGMFLAGFASVLLPALGVAFFLGLQPRIAMRPDGSPLFFPFGWEVTFPAVVLPHLALGMAEGALTILVFQALKPFRIEPRDKLTTKEDVVR